MRVCVCLEHENNTVFSLPHTYNVFHTLNLIFRGNFENRTKRNEPFGFDDDGGQIMSNFVFILNLPFPC